MFLLYLQSSFLLQVGDIRAGRTTILDTYLLKSLDVFDFDALWDGLPGCLRLTLEIKDLAIWQLV